MEHQPEVKLTSVEEGKPGLWGNAGHRVHPSRQSDQSTSLWIGSVSEPGLSQKHQTSDKMEVNE